MGKLSLDSSGLVKTSQAELVICHQHGLPNKFKLQKLKKCDMSLSFSETSWMVQFKHTPSACPEKAYKTVA